MAASSRFTHLNNAFYDLERFRAPLRRLAASCRCADGDRSGHQEHARGARGAPITRRPIRNGWVAVGDCAANGGVFAGKLCGLQAGVKDVIPVDLHIRGCPAAPRAAVAGGCSRSWTSKTLSAARAAKSQAAE